MTATLEERIAALPPQKRAGVNVAYPEAHTAMIAAGEQPSILEFWDALPWLTTGSDWTPWRAYVAALYGLPMTSEELEIFRACTGRLNPPTERALESWVPTGRRGRKTACVAVIASYEAAYRDHSLYLAPGERAMIPLISKDKADAKTLKGFVEEIFKNSSLNFLLDGEPTAEEIRLKNRCDFMIRAASLTAGRSKSIPFAALDELAFFHSDNSANPDVEIDRGIQGGMLLVPNAMRIGLSSPYAKRGLLYDKYKEHYGKDGRVLVWKAPTLTMHPGNPVTEEKVRKAYADDPVSAAAEYGGDFREDVEIFTTEEIVDNVIVKGRIVLPPVPGIQYLAFADPSGGSSDSMTLAIGHWDAPRHRCVLDYIEETPGPFDPKVVVESHARILKQYDVREVMGDHYAGLWPTSKYAEHHIMYHTCPRPRAQLYLDFLPLMNAGMVELLDHKRMRNQLVSLDRISGRGRDIVDHPPGQHDDVANAVAGCLVRVDGWRPRTVEPKAPPPKDTHEILRMQLRESMKQKDKKGPNPWAK